MNEFIRREDTQYVVLTLSPGSSPDGSLVTGGATVNIGGTS